MKRSNHHSSRAHPVPDLWCERDAVTRRTYDRFASRYTERYFHTRALDEEMDRFLAHFPPSPILFDAGCGPGHQAQYFDTKGARAVGLDYSFPMLREGRRRNPHLRLVHGDLLALPFLDHTFDGIWARASLLHMEDAAHWICLMEFHRVLRSGGILYAAVRRGDGETDRQEVQDGIELARYFRFWQPEEWHDLLRAAGFDVLDHGMEDGDPEDWLWVYARR
ncbi:MAG: class I SAM-dependent methyltransferase, partial [Armatimonadetes bacterium]|nr:class I SAM-dependent methyltransferase [Armatimonadota bacterium]